MKINILPTSLISSNTGPPLTSAMRFLSRIQAPLRRSHVLAFSFHRKVLTGFRGLSTLGLSESTVSCTTINHDGNIENMLQRVPKTDLLKRLDLYPRDFRRIDNSLVDIVPTIAVRKNCILVNLLHIKSVITEDRIMIFDSLDLASVQKLSLFIYDLQDKLKTNANHNTSFEFKALESVLMHVMAVLESDLDTHIHNCTEILTGLENLIERNKLRDLLIYSKALTTYSQKALLIRNVLDELLETDEDLKGMYLTRMVNPKAVEDSEDFNFSEVEILLENYYSQCDEFVQQANSLILDIKSTEEIVNIILDANRNSLMLYDLRITIYTLGFTVATTVPAFYGMNLKNFIEELPYGFGAVVGISVVSAFAITALNFHKLRITQNLTMTLGNDKTFDRYVSQTLELPTSSVPALRPESSNLARESAIRETKSKRSKWSSLFDRYNWFDRHNWFYRWRMAHWAAHFDRWYAWERNLRSVRRMRKFLYRSKFDNCSKLNPRQKAMAWKWLLDQRNRK